jgi:hypothetical protein
MRKHTKQVQQCCTLSNRSTAREWNPVTKGVTCVVLNVFMLMGNIRKPSQEIILQKVCSNFNTNVGNIITSKPNIRYLLFQIYFCKNLLDPLHNYSVANTMAISLQTIAFDYNYVSVKTIRIMLKLLRMHYS